nr:FGGY-family carbohydrate kinase [Pelagibacterium limicola]
MRHVGVIDVGKTNAKVVAVDLSAMRETAVRTAPNRVLAGPPYAHFDIDGLWGFIRTALAEINREFPLDAISITTHGACAALITEDGSLALPVLDYESADPEASASAYDAIRPGFETSYSPRLPGGLNLGAQLFYQARRYPQAFAQVRWILTYPQYWAYRFTGVTASELTSLGCHTDLWDFRTWGFSSLVKEEGWLDRFPPLQPADGALGPMRADLARELGLASSVPVACGIHDSNASLVPHFLMRQPPFSVVSTGTWVIACSPGGDLERLDPTRDCLANIDAFGRPVPSARFMGGREFSTLIPSSVETPSSASAADILARGVMLLPTILPGSGPFPNRTANWTQDPESLSQAERHVVASFYLALMTSECLVMTAGEGVIAVEGPFSRNALYCAMLASATGRPVVTTENATGTSIGAAMLVAPSQGAAPPVADDEKFLPDPPMARYAAAWRSALERTA